VFTPNKESTADDPRDHSEDTAGVPAVAFKPKLQKAERMLPWIISPIKCYLHNLPETARPFQISFQLDQTVKVTSEKKNCKRI
jgi:hypothetical protein